MRFYVASGLENAVQVRLAVEHLRSLGHVHTYDWTAHGDIRAQGETRMREVARNEVNAVMTADFVLALMPGARGTHTELGVALATAILQGGKDIWLWSQSGEHFAHDQRTCTFYFHPAIRRKTGSFSALLKELTLAFGSN